MTLTDPSLPAWFKTHGFESFSDILTTELGVEAYADFRLLRDEKDANELLDDMCALKAMDDTFKKKFKTQVMKIIKGTDISAMTPIVLIPKTETPHKKRRKSKSKSQSRSRPQTPTKDKSDKNTLPKPKDIKKASSYDSRHKKTRSSLTISKKEKKPKSRHSSSEIKAKKSKHSKANSSIPRSATHNKLHIKSNTNTDTYDVGSIVSTLPYNKGKKSKLKKAHSSKDFGNKSKHKKSSSMVSLSRKQHKEEKNKSRGGFSIHTNRRVRLDDGRVGIVKYKGRTAFGKSGEDWIGIVVEYGKGQHNGSVNGRSYFRCRDGKGLMVRPDRILEDLGNPMTKPLDDAMKKGSPEIQAKLKSIRKERVEAAQRKKREAMEAAAAKENSNYGGSVGWKPGKFDDYKPDDGSMFQKKLYNPKTLLDKNKDIKAAKKKKMNEI